MRLLVLTRVECARPYVTHGSPIEARSARTYVGTRVSRGITMRTWIQPETMPHACDVSGCVGNRQQRAWTRVAMRLAAHTALLRALPRELVDVILSHIR